METSQFWQLVTRQSANESSDEIIKRLENNLNDLSDEELAMFDKIMGQQLRRSYTWDIWGAAYIVAGCDSDYAFAEFRCFLISLGEAWYNSIVESPDKLGTLDVWPEKDNYAYPFVEDLDLIAGKIYEDRTGHELPFVPANTKTPAGKKFSTKPKVLKQTYPNLSARFPF